MQYRLHVTGIQPETLCVMTSIYSYIALSKQGTLDALMCGQNCAGNVMETIKECYR